MDNKAAAIRYNALRGEIKTIWEQIEDLLGSGMVDSDLIANCASDMGDRETEAAQLERWKVYTLLQDAIDYIFFSHFPDLKPDDWEPLINSPLDPPEGAADWRDWLIHGRAEAPEEQEKIDNLINGSAAIYSAEQAD